MITASVGAGSSLLLEPARELLFPLPDVTSEHRPRCVLTLTNLSLVNDVVFRVRTRNPDAFTVRPTHGLLAPGTSSQVLLTATVRSCKHLGAMDPRDLMTRQSSELFLVQNVEREEEVQAIEPLDPNSSTSLREFWKKVPRDCLTENKLVCCFVAATPEVSSSKMFSRSMSSVSSRLKVSRTSQSDNRNFSMSAREPRLTRSGSSSEHKLNRSFSNQYAEPRERSRQPSFGSDTSFHTTIEPPLRMERRSETRMSASADYGISRTSRTKLRDTALTSISLNDSSVSDTMLSAQSAFFTDTAAKEPSHELGPLLYHIQPNDTLSFNVTPAQRYWGSTSCFIVNSSQNDCLTFKVRTSNQSGYVVKPSRGLVSTTSAQEVVISLCAPRHETSFDPTQREAKDGFMVEVANISRDKYDELMKLDERKRFCEISSLWSLMPRSDRQSMKLSVNLNMENSHSGSGIRESSESGRSDSHSMFDKSRTEKAQRQTLKSVVRGLKELSTSSLRDESHGSIVEDKVNYEYSDSDESVFTIASTVAPTAVDENNSDGDVVSTPASRDSTVIVVSADRIDTVDFSNPKLSFFI